MIDTVDIFHQFNNHYEYDDCRQAVDKLARKLGQPLHTENLQKKTSTRTWRFTTVFSALGVLNIVFYSYSSLRYSASYCRMFLKPARIIAPKTNIRLAQENEFERICNSLDNFIDTINKTSGFPLLPPLKQWRTNRIDYAINIETPYVSEYLRLFHAGMIPTGFNPPKKKDGEDEKYEDSFYLISNEGNINFYDKVQQLKKKKRHPCTDSDISSELGRIPDGILRLEFQCKGKYISRLKESYQLQDTTLPSLWDPAIAKNELIKRVHSIVGELDFYSYKYCEQKLEEKYAQKTVIAYRTIINRLCNNPNLSLGAIKETLTGEKRKYFASLLTKIRKVGVNPIPLDVAGELPVEKLTNPCELISEAFK